MIVLDAHAWMWWLTGDRRHSRKARTLVEADDVRGVSPNSCVEAGRLATRHRLEFDRDVDTWIRQALAQPAIVVVDVTTQIPTSAALLDPFHGDPTDRVLVATAMDHGAVLVTRDARFRRRRALRTAW